MSNKNLRVDYDRRAVVRRNYTKIRMVYGRPLYLFGIGCTHYGGTGFSKASYEFFKERWADKFLNEPNYYAYLLGDLLDKYRTSSQFQNRELQEDSISAIEQRQMEDAEGFVRDFAFLKGNVLGSVEGNHGGYMPECGMTADEFIASKLGADPDKHGGILLHYLDLIIGNKAYPIKIQAYHGKRGGGVYAGSLLHELEQKVRSFDSDIMLSAHAHTPIATKLARICTEKDSISASPILLMRTGSWNKSYEQDKEHYAVRALYNPSALAMTYITITAYKIKGEVKIHMEFHG